MPFTAKFDYDNQDFYDAIQELASRGYTDAEIAYGLEDLAGTPRSPYPNDIWPDLPQLNPITFGKMKNGKYAGWTDEENKSRSEHICRVLARARNQINIAVRNSYLQLALGRATTSTSSTVKRYVRERCQCKGKDKSCPICGGTGWHAITEKEVIMETETETRHAPAPQMAGQWLHHHDPEWRHRNMMRHEENAGKDNEVTGIDIQVVYNDKKDLELQERNKKGGDDGSEV